MTPGNDIVLLMNECWPERALKNKRRAMKLGFREETLNRNLQVHFEKLRQLHLGVGKKFVFNKGEGHEMRVQILPLEKKKEQKKSNEERFCIGKSISE
jgi:hypothetical protein